MRTITFITGNEGKAKWLSKHLNYPIERLKLDLDEIQSLNLEEIVEHKVKEAYSKIQEPVLVEDISLKFNALGNLPGPLIKWFLEEEKVGIQGLCNLLNQFDDRSAIAKVAFGYFDGEKLELFSNSKKGIITKNPLGDNGFGWDYIFIPDGANKTYAQMTEEEQVQFSLRIPVFKEIEKYLKSWN